jgi:hypothetical protein
MVSEEEKKNFEKKGYLLLKNYFSEYQLDGISKISFDILNKASSGKWKYIRVYRDYPNFFGRINIFGVDYPLNKKLDPNLFNEFQKLEYKHDVLNILGWKNFYTPLIRLHTNSNFYNYQGEWHRDDKNFPSPNSIQVIIYLMDEEGYRIIPKNKNYLLEEYGIKKDRIRNPMGDFYKLPDKAYEVISAKKGDILIHESGLMHQGFCKKKRMHFHIRHIKKDNPNLINISDKYNFTEKYQKDYDLELFKVQRTYVNKKSFFEKLFKFKTFILYFFPRLKFIINNLFKREKYSIFHSTFWQ